MKPDLVSLEAAVEAILARCGALDSVEVPPMYAGGMTLAAAIKAPRDLPAEDASLMDGYAVRAAEAARGTALRVAFEVPAGSVAPRALGPGECARIFTGAPIPAGADAVVMQEQAAREGENASFSGQIRTAEHIRRQASDAAVGDVLLAGGSRLDAGSLALVASLGLGTVSVRRPPLVAILATGDELVAPGGTAGPGQVFEANTPGLALQALDAGARPVVLETARDDAAQIIARLQSVDADILVTSGGASVGDYDFAQAVLEGLGGEKVFWQVAIRPGKPVLFGVIEDVGRRRLFFALPGNPGASALTFDLFVRTAIRALLGDPNPRRPRVRAVLAAAVQKPKHLTQLGRGRLVARGTQLVFEPAPQQGSMSVRSLAGLGAVAILGEPTDRLETGAEIDVEPWSW